MADTRKGLTCDYCGAAFTLKYDPEELQPAFCAFCSESLEAPTEELEEEIDEVDDDYEEDAEEFE
jgi:hypothetical protein